MIKTEVDKENYVYVPMALKSVSVQALEEAIASAISTLIGADVCVSISSFELGPLMGATLKLTLNREFTEFSN